MDWVTIFTIIAVNIALFSWMRSDLRAFETEIRGWKNEINKEMKDFHGRLERQDAEFRQRFLAIEERRGK